MIVSPNLKRSSKRWWLATTYRAPRSPIPSSPLSLVILSYNFLLIPSAILFLQWKTARMTLAPRAVFVVSCHTSKLNLKYTASFIRMIGRTTQDSQIRVVLGWPRSLKVIGAWTYALRDVIFWYWTDCRQATPTATSQLVTSEHITKPPVVKFLCALRSGSTQIKQCST